MNVYNRFTWIKLKPINLGKILLCERPDGWVIACGFIGAICPVYNFSWNKSYLSKNICVLMVCHFVSNILVEKKKKRGINHNFNSIENQYEFTHNMKIKRLLSF